MRRYLVFVTASLGLLMYTIDGTAVAVAFPSFIRDLHTDVLWAGWTMSMFSVGICMAMPLAGNLSDSFGRKKVFLVSLILFTASSLACGLAPNIHALIAFRLLQGIGGASFLPTASGMASDHFPESRQTVIGLFSSVFNVGSIIGPNLGGWIVSRYSWRYIFYINVPIGIGLMGLTMLLLKDAKIRSRPYVDVRGAVTMSGAILFLMFGLNLIGESFSAPFLLSAAVLILISLVLGKLFLSHEKNAARPILDLTLLQSRPFVAANLMNLVTGAAILALFAFIPLYATSVHGLSTLMSGIILTPRSLGTIAASATTSFLLRRWGYRWPMVWGLSIVSGATILLTPGLPLGGLRLDSAGALSFVVLIAGIGSGITTPAVNNACIELMPEKVATIVGLRGTFRIVGQALGISLITFILHLSLNPVTGFRITFIAFGLLLLSSLPLVFLMPSGKGERIQTAA
ncbi:MAG TPA: MFS transporter [Syntrophorhabdales bacterium]|nr:MFS transporter [Syntrophorhabdales bacterium]